VSGRGVRFVGFRVDDAERYAAMVAHFRDGLGLAVIAVDGDRSTRFRLGDGAELHVYGPADTDHERFGDRACIGLWVDDVEAARRSLEAAGVEILDPEAERDGTAAWFHYLAPDGSVQEVVGPDRSGTGAVAGRS
jgi:hypothetical protein